MTSAALRSWKPANDLRTSNAYMPSSLVGTKISPPNPSSYVHLFLYKISTTGIRYDKVFPLPVLALHTISLPISACVIDALCTSVIFMNLDLNRPLEVFFETGKSLNLILIKLLSPVSITFL